jgi:hypothetical protein
MCKEVTSRENIWDLEVKPLWNHGIYFYHITRKLYLTSNNKTFVLIECGNLLI